MPRHLKPSEIESALNRGKSVEQFLGPTNDGNIVWIELRPTAAGIELWRYEVIDEGDSEFLDLYAFTPSDDDWPEGPASTHGTAAEALGESEGRHGASELRWVNQFVIQDEYSDYLANK